MVAIVGSNSAISHIQELHQGAHDSRIKEHLKKIDVSFICPVVEPIIVLIIMGVVCLKKTDDEHVNSQLQAGDLGRVGRTLLANVESFVRLKTSLKRVLSFGQGLDLDCSSFSSSD